jgi:hypothetical protein
MRINELKKKKKKKNKPGMVGDTLNPNTWEAKAGQS